MEHQEGVESHLLVLFYHWYTEKSNNPRFLNVPEYTFNFVLSLGPTRTVNFNIFSRAF